MLSGISNGTVAAVAALVAAWHGAEGNREAAVAPLLSSLERQGWRLLSFFSYLLSHNKVWKSLDDDPFTAITPAPTQVAEFEEFMALLRHYQGATVTAANEQPLIRFLSRCTGEIQELYLAVLSRQKWLREMLYRSEFRAQLTPEKVDPEAIYGGTTLLTEGWYAVSYPLIVTAVPESELTPAIIYKTGNTVRIKKLTVLNRNSGRARTERLSNSWLSVDRQFITADTFVLYGMMAVETREFYPLDFFTTLDEYQQHRKRPSVPFAERQQRLDRFLESSYLRQIKKGHRALCLGDPQLAEGIAKALRGSPHTAVLFCDSKGRTHRLGSEIREGVIGELWQEQGRVLGFYLWRNTRRLPCAWDFSGENNALLYRPRLLRGRHVRFAQLEIKGHRAGTLQEILWDKRPYYQGTILFRDGNIGSLERCPVCLRDDIRHLARCGVCQTTYINWRSMMASRGTDVWFTPSRKIRERRELCGWEPSAVNNLWIAFRGYRIVANDQGQLMFKSDPETQRHYEKSSRSEKFLFNTRRISENPAELQEWYRKNYQIKGKEPTHHESGDLREVSELHDHEPLETAGEG